jgi:hypothetical protein
VKGFCSVVISLAALLGALLAQPASPVPGVRFQAVDVFIDSGEIPLAAYQLEFTVRSGNARVVGVEGGEHAAFKEAPFYDPKAIQHERVIIAAFSTARARQLPKGKTRIATIHLQITGNSSVAFDVTNETAAAADGKRLTVRVSSAERDAK